MVVGISLLQAVYGYFASDNSYVVFFVSVGLALGLWVAGSGAIYSYTALSGGVMNHAEWIRQRRPEA